MIARRTLLLCLTGISWATAALSPRCPAAGFSPYVAFSLKEAARRASTSAQSDRTVEELGGMTEIAGLVFDPRERDVILVGRARQALPAIRLDDLAVCLRAVLLHKASPLVSIDKTPETSSTGRQRVHFEGGLENTRLGADMLAIDVVLKKLALGQLPGEVWGVKSYVALGADDAARNRAESHVSSRFWFKNRRPAIAERDGVFAIVELEIGVDTEVLADTRSSRDPRGMRDEIGDRFASSVEASLGDLCMEHPVLKKARPILALVAVAGGVASMGLEPLVRFWLEEHRIERAETPADFPVLSARKEIAGSDLVLTVNGGVELSPIVLRLQSGDVTALREAVLDSRPGPGTLVWHPELDGWEIPGTSEGMQSCEPLAAARPGFSLDRSLGSGPGGASRLPAAPVPGALLHAGAALPKFRRAESLIRQQYSSRVGGVLLQGAAKVEGDGSSAPGLDPSGKFSLVLEGRGSRLDPWTYRKFVTALWAVYFGKEPPGVSIDPMGPHIDKHLVRYIGNVLNTDLGRVMREADYVMKKWAVGTERPAIPGFEDVDSLAAKHGIRRLGVSRRFWFVPEEMVFRQADGALLFQKGEMTLKTEYIFQEHRERAEPADVAFAQFFTRNYASIMKEYPVYAELLDYAKLVALSRYLKESGVPLFWFLMANRDLVITEDSPGTVDALAKGSAHFEGMTLQGGVDLGTSGRYVPDPEVLHALSPAGPVDPRRSGELRDHDDRVAATPPYPEVGQLSYTVVPQKSLTSGRDRRGVRYQTDLALREGMEPALELVRCYQPSRREPGEFGDGWHLLIPFRIRPAGEGTRRFLGAVIPERMAVENLLTGEEEILSFSENRYSIAGYVPERLESTLTVGLFMTADASFRLADKLGTEFWFDPEGNLTDILLPDQKRLSFEYQRGFTDAVECTPYAIRRMDGSGIEIHRGHLPSRLVVKDLIGKKDETLVPGTHESIIGYVPERKGASRFIILAILSDASFQLLDKHGNEFTFTPAGDFKTLSIAGERPRVRSVSDGKRKVVFSYAVDPTGRVRVSSARLAEAEGSSRGERLVTYHRDQEGRLSAVAPGDRELARAGDRVPGDGRSERAAAARDARRRASD